jgi:predicted dehydrogenase
MHVFVEKPLSMTMKESEEIHELVLSSKKHLAVGYFKRYAPAYNKVTQLLEEIGTISSINTTFGCRNFAKDPTDYLLQAAIHAVNLTQAYAGDIKEINTIMSTVESNFSILSVLKCTNDVSVSLTLLASDSWAKLNEELIITGTKGFIKYNNNSGLEIHINNIEKTTKPRWQQLDELTTTYRSVSTTGSGGFQDLYLKGFIPEVEHFLNCIKTNTTPLTNSLDNLNTMIWVDKILNS